MLGGVQLILRGTAHLVHHHHDGLERWFHRIVAGQRRTTSSHASSFAGGAPSAAFQDTQQATEQSSATTTPPVLQICHLRDVGGRAGHHHLRLLSSAVFQDWRHRRAFSSSSCHFVLRHRQPLVQEFWTKEQRERGAELLAHGAVQNEVDAGVDQGQDIHQVTWWQKAKGIGLLHLKVKWESVEFTVALCIVHIYLLSLR